MPIKENVVFAEERKRQIVELINHKKKLIIPELCSRFGVSASTIRNDLRNLQDSGKLTRTHGGAILNSKSGFEPLPLDKETHRLEAKQAIAERALELVEDGDIIAVGTGTTTFEFVKRLGGKRGLTVILNDIYFAAFLERFEDVNVIVVGGTLRKKFHYLQMPAGADVFANMNIDKAFISCNGVHIERGVTTPDPALAHDVRRMVAASSELFLLCDSSKIGSVSFARITGTDRINALITDADIDDGDAAELRLAGVDIVVAGGK